MSTPIRKKTVTIPFTPPHGRSTWDQPGSFLGTMPFSLDLTVTPGSTKAHGSPLRANGLSPMKFRFEVIGDIPPEEPVTPIIKPRKLTHSKKARRRPKLSEFIPREIDWEPAGAGTLAPSVNKGQDMSKFLYDLYGPTRASRQEMDDPMQELVMSSPLQAPVEVNGKSHDDMDTQLDGGKVTGVGDELMRAPNPEIDDVEPENDHPGKLTTKKIHPQLGAQDGGVAEAGQGLPFPVDRSQLCEYLSRGLSLCSLFPSQVVGGKVQCSGSLQLAPGGQWKQMVYPCNGEKFSSTENYQRHIKSHHIQIKAPRAGKGRDNRGVIETWVRLHHKEKGVIHAKESKTLYVSGALLRSAMPPRPPRPPRKRESTPTPTPSPTLTPEPAADQAT